MPQCYPQNIPFVALVKSHLAPENVLQYQTEERSLIASRVRVSHGRFDELMSVMREDIISSDEFVSKLSGQLREHFTEPKFDACETMGELVYTSIMQLLDGAHPATSPLDL